MRVFLLIGLCLASLWFGLAQTPLFSYDEAVFSQTTRQMIDSKRWFEPTYLDEYRFRKPPGIYWLQAASVNIFGGTQGKTQPFFYRLPSFLASVMTLILLYLWVRRELGMMPAFWSVVILSTSLWFQVEAHQAKTDALQLLSVVITQWGLWEVYKASGEKRDPGYWPWIFWFGLSLGALIKGATIAVAILCLMMLSIWDRNIAWLKMLKPVRGIFLFLVFGMTWAIPLSFATGTNFVSKMIEVDLTPKLGPNLSDWSMHHPPPGVHLFMLLLTFWPASVLFPELLKTARANLTQPYTRFLIFWVVPSWLFFESWKTKYPQYLFVVFPALAILTSMLLKQKFETTSKMVVTYRILWCLVSASSFLVLFLGLDIFFGDLRMISIVTSAIFIGLALALAYRPDLFMRSAACLYLGFILLWGFNIPSAPFMRVHTELLSALKERVSENIPLIVSDLKIPTLAFALGVHKIIPADSSHSNGFSQKYPRSCWAIRGDNQKLNQQLSDYEEIWNEYYIFSYRANRLTILCPKTSSYGSNINFSGRLPTQTADL